MRKIVTRNLTPKKAWNIYVGTSEEIFISNYMGERTPITDTKKMCDLYSRELPIIFEDEKILFSDKQLADIKVLITEHLEGYIESKGGIDKLKLLTEKELAEIIMANHEEVMESLADRLGTTRDGISKAMTKK